MTEADLIQSIAAYSSSTQGWLGLYVSALTAYLVTAYLAGSNLTPSQTLIISTCFIIFACLCAFSGTANTARVVDFTLELAELNPNRKFAAQSWVIHVLEVVLYSGILVALKFMWDIRHPKTE